MIRIMSPLPRRQWTTIRSLRAELKPQQDEPVLLLVREGSGGLLEADAVLSLIRASLLRIPLEAEVRHNS